MKDINRKLREGTAMCPFYKEVDRVLGSQAVSTPITLIDSNAPSTVIGKPMFGYCNIYS